MKFYLYFPHLLSHLRNILYNRPAYNAAVSRWISRKSLQGRPHFSYVSLNSIYTRTVKPDDILKAKNILIKSASCIAECATCTFGNSVRLHSAVYLTVPLTRHDTLWCVVTRTEEIESLSVISCMCVSTDPHKVDRQHGATGERIYPWCSCKTEGSVAFKLHQQ
jgi:hypothetical protein